MGRIADDAHAVSPVVAPELAGAVVDEDLCGQPIEMGGCGAFQPSDDDFSPTLLRLPPVVRKLSQSNDVLSAIGLSSCQT